MKNKTIAICYDFDKTLSPNDMQAQGFIQSIGYDVQEFWMESYNIAKLNDMDSNLAYMYMMVNKAKGKINLTKNLLKEFGKKIELYEGVQNWFDRINNFGKNLGLVINHYIISSGLKEMIEGTSIANKFTEIYASSFLYDEKGFPVWPAMSINYTNKTQFLFRISKGINKVYDDRVNDCFQSYKIPFNNIIYIGDSATDVPCMKLTLKYSGKAIGVYNPALNDKMKVEKLLKEKRIDFYAPANYLENSLLDIKVKNIIEDIASNNR